MNAQPVVEVADVSQFYGSPAVRALDAVSLRVHAGEMVGIVGPSGSGKSTLMSIMGTLDRPSHGEVIVEGEVVSQLNDADLSSLRATRVGFVFQQFHLSDVFTALDNVADGLLYTGLSRSERRDRAGRALDSVGLADRVGHRPQQLSGGERQRVAIARALVKSPAIVLADEPTGNLDQRSGHEVVELFERLNDAGTTIVIITHDRSLAERLPRRVEVSDGRIVFDSAEEPAHAAR